MRSPTDRLRADEAQLAADVEIAADSVIRARRVVLGAGVRIGAGVDITCDVLELGDGCSVGDGARIMCPHVAMADGCALGSELTAELNQRLRLGRHSAIGRRARIAGQAIDAGEYLWLKDDVIIGGGGAYGPRSHLRVGDRSTIVDRAFINLSEHVEIGSDTALSFNVAVLTHGAWQPALDGHRIDFAPVRIGDHSVVYVNSVVLPGVTIGSHATIAAGSVVRHDVPDGCLAAGNPARIRRGPHDSPPPLEVPAREALILDLLTRWTDTLPTKGVQVLENRLADNGRLTVLYDGRAQTIALGDQDADITLSRGTADGRSRCHLDLAARTITGQLCPLAEDLRDFLRRHTIRLYTNQPFRALPPANLARLRAARQRAD